MDKATGAGNRALLLKDLRQLAASTALDRETDPRRVLPVIPPALLWRILPRLYRRAAALGLAAGELDRAAADFLVNCAAAIDGGKGA